MCFFCCWLLFFYRPKQYRIVFFLTVLFPDGHVAELSSPINPSLSIYLRRNTRKHCKEHSENIYAMWHYKTHAPSSIFNTALEYNNIREHKTYWKKSSVLLLFLLLTSHHVCLLGARYGYGSIIVDTVKFTTTKNTETEGWVREVISPSETSKTFHLDILTRVAKWKIFLYPETQDESSLS